MVPVHRPSKMVRSFAAIGLAMAATLAVSACAVDSGGQPAKGEAPARLVSAGEHVAERNCAECHALGEVAVSPLAEAPTFRNLRAAYGRAEMEQIIRERMQEIHPRMPKLELDVDEIGAFLDYWEDLAVGAAQSRTHSGRAQAS